MNIEISAYSNDVMHSSHLIADEKVNISSLMDDMVCIKSGDTCFYVRFVELQIAMDALKSLHK